MAAQLDMPESWIEHQHKLQDLAERQLFFVGGAPRSGTTWLQYLLDSHPEICCRGEGHFWKTLAEPLANMMKERRRVLDDKNKSVFRHSGGYPLPELEESKFLVGTAILLAFERQCAGATYRAIGEKTPDNVFYFGRLKRLFPNAKFLYIARDPRDVLTSAWHFFIKQKADGDEGAAKIEWLRQAIPQLQHGARAMLAFCEQHRADSMIVTYERMLAAPADVAAQLFQFLAVAHDEAIVAECVARTSFAALSGGRSAGITQEGSFFRKGVAGEWRSTLTPEMNEMVLRELGWMFPIFGWEQ